MYQVLFKSPENRLIKDWISVENLTSETKSKENQKKSESLANKKKDKAFTYEKILYT